MVVNISSCFVWNSKGELQLGYSKFSLLFKDDFYPLLITVFVPDATKTGGCLISLDRDRDKFPHISTLLCLYCNVLDLHFLGKTCDSTHILIYFFQRKSAIYFFKFLVQFFIRAKQTFHKPFYECFIK